MELERVVITGMGCVTPIGNNIIFYRNSLEKGKSGADRITRFDTSDFNAKIACEVTDFSLVDLLEGATSRGGKTIDLSSQYAQVAAQEAMEDAGLILPNNVNPDRTSVIIGTGIGGLWTLEKEITRMVERDERGPRRVSPFMIPMVMPNAVAANIASQIGAHGQAITGNSACSSATDMMGVAYQMLISGSSDVIVTGGSEAAITKVSVAGYSNMNALTLNYNGDPQSASRPFDRDRSGFVLGEGAGILIFETLKHAESRGARIYSEVLGFGSTCDAGHITQPNENGVYAAMAIQIALKQSKINPDQVDYINAHGTSTQLNDITETRAIKRVFGEHAHKLAISSTKSMHGHALGASGGLELVATILGMRHDFIPPTINLDNPGAGCDLDYVPNEARFETTKIAISQSFGFGGHNAVLVVRKYSG